jgi:hypothetical protein
MKVDELEIIRTLKSLLPWTDSLALLLLHSFGDLLSANQNDYFNSKKVEISQLITV